MDRSPSRRHRAVGRNRRRRDPNGRGHPPRGGTLFVCGNGGSAGEATHLIGELIGPSLDKNRGPISGVALGFDTSALTAVSNDFSFAEILSRPLSAFAWPGDVLWVLSTSGRSPSILLALKVAAATGITSTLVTGSPHADFLRSLRFPHVPVVFEFLRQSGEP